MSVALAGAHRSAYIQVSLQWRTVGVGETPRSGDPEVRQKVSDMSEDRVTLLREGQRCRQAGRAAYVGDTEDAQDRSAARCGIHIILDIDLLEYCALASVAGVAHSGNTDRRRESLR
jgi:hypothetical protein